MQLLDTLHRWTGGLIGLDEFRQDASFARPMVRAAGSVEPAVALPAVPDIPGTRGSEVVGSDGVIRVKAPDGKLYIHPLVTGMYVIRTVQEARRTGSATALRAAAWQLDALVKDSVMVGGARFLPYRFDWSIIQRRYPAPWYSGMTQGVDTLAFGILGLVPGYERYMDRAEEVFATLRRRHVNSGTPWVAGVDRRGFLWLDEYPSADGRLSQVYNGHCYAATSLLDLYPRVRASRPLFASQLHAVGVGALTTAFEYRTACRQAGHASSYTVGAVMPDPHYHIAHIEIMNSLWARTGRTGFATTLDQMVNDFPLTQTGGRIVMRPGTHVLCKFDKSGVPTAQRTFAPSTITSCTASARTQFPGSTGANGRWLLIKDGFLAGWYVHEVPGQCHLTGTTVDQVVFTMPRTVVFGGNQRVVAKGYSTAGDVVRTVDNNFTTPSLASSDRRACIEGRQMIHITNGTFAGLWVPEGRTVAYKA